MAGNASATYDPWFRIPLTSTGQQQAREAGQRIKDIIRDETLYVYVSPYLRATQTLDYVREALDPRQVLVPTAATATELKQEQIRDELKKL